MRLEKLLGEVGGGNGNQDAHHPGQLVELGVELRFQQFDLGVEMLAGHQIRLCLGNNAHHSFGLFLVETGCAQLADKFVGVKSNRAHSRILPRLTSADNRRYSVRKELDNSEASGIRTRQTCGFFTPVPRSMAGRGRKHNTRKGNTVRQLALVINLPAALPVRVITLQQGLSRLSKERVMHTLTIGTSEIRQLDGLYSLNDLHLAAGSEEKHRPNQFIRIDTTQALIAEIETAQICAVKTKEGRKGGTYVCRELVIAYAAWISPAFHLKVIRHFLDTRVGAGETALAPAYITPEQQGVLFNIVARRSGDSGAIRPYMWSRFQNHFQVNSYKNLPLGKFDEAVAYLEAMPMKGEKQQAALPAPAGHRPMKPPVVTKTAGSHTGAARNIHIVRQVIGELKLWGFEELPREVSGGFDEALSELSSLLTTGWTELDEAISHLHIAQRYLSRWQGRPN